MTWNFTSPPEWFRRAQWKAPWSKRNGVHYVGDDVIVDLNWTSNDATVVHRKMTGFEWGVDGNVLLVTDREMSTPFGSVNGSPVYSSTHAYGDLSMKVAAANQYLTYTINGSSDTDQYGRVYLYATANPAALAWIVRTQYSSLQVQTDGKLYMGFNPAFTTPIALNQWVRIEWRMKWGPTQADSIYEVKLFNSPDSATATETKQFTNCFAQTSNGVCSVGLCDANAWGTDIWIDNYVAGDSSYPGPYSPTEDEPPAHPVTYDIRDYYGTTVSSGVFEEDLVWFRPTAPSGGWQPGWYRMYLSGPETDATFGDSYGVTNFCVVRDDSHFVAMPAGDTVGGYNGEAPDLVMKGVMGLGTSRLIITDCASPAAEIATAQQELAITQAYWSDNGIPDSERPPREPWCTFPHCDGSPAQLAGVTTVVAALYPDCKYFEGPSNEPNPNSAGTATAMQAFQTAVHAGNAGAKAIGPCAVSIPPMETWTGFLNASGGTYCDAISFHAYNAVTNGDINLGKSTISGFKTLLASYSLSGKDLWQTESAGPGIIPYGIYHPRRARKALMETLLFEQYGVPRERNNWWYDTSHGFWDVPAWIENGDGSIEAAVVLGRVLAEETWGKPYASALDFGTVGNAMFLGNVYSGTAGKTVALMATSYMTGASVTLTITGDADPVTVVDGFGRSREIPLSKGRVTVSVTDVPSYVRLSTAASATVYRVNGHSPLGLTASVSPGASTKQIDGVTYSVIADDAYMTNYGAGTGIAPTTWATPPSTATLIWATATTVSRVVVWCGPAWQPSGTLVDFDVQTYDGATWTTRKTVTKQTPPWFDFASDSWTQACFNETFWDEQWVFDIELDAAVSCRGVRLSVREASYGGEPLPDTSIAQGAGGGQGNSVQGYRIEEIAVVDTNRYAALGA